MLLIRAARWIASTDLHTIDDDEEDEVTVDDDVHVVPRNDLIDHDTDEDCVCGPTPEPVFRPDGSNSWVYRHHSLDAREKAE